MNSGDDELQVELKRYLCGVPFSQVREITREERKALVREVAPYGVLAALTGVGIAWLLLMAAQASSAGMAIFLVGMASALACIPAYCAFWSWSHLQSLRSGNVFSYLGRMNDLAAFDVAQAHFQTHYTLDEHLDRYVEVLATGKGDRIWRFEGVSDQGRLRKVRPIYLALVPDHDERGRRSLTKEESEELRLRASDFKNPRAFFGKNLFTWYLMLQGAKAAYVVAPALALSVSVVVFTAVAFSIWAPYRKRRAFARALEEDASAGFVQDGFLASGLPWTMNGDPARWRLGRAIGGSDGVTKEQALLLQAGHFGDDEDDGEEWEEEEVHPEADPSTRPRRFRFGR